MEYACDQSDKYSSLKFGGCVKPIARWLSRPNGIHWSEVHWVNSFDRNRRSNHVNHIERCEQQIMRLKMVGRRRRGKNPISILMKIIKSK